MRARCCRTNETHFLVRPPLPFLLLYDLHCLSSAMADNRLYEFDYNWALERPPFLGFLKVSEEKKLDGELGVMWWCKVKYLYKNDQIF